MSKKTQELWNMARFLGLIERDVKLRIELPKLPVPGHKDDKDSYCLSWGIDDDSVVVTSYYESHHNGDYVCEEKSWVLLESLEGERLLDTLYSVLLGRVREKCRLQDIEREERERNQRVDEHVWCIVGGKVVVGND